MFGPHATHKAQKWLDLGVWAHSSTAEQGTHNPPAKSRKSLQNKAFTESAMSDGDRKEHGKNQNRPFSDPSEAARIDPHLARVMAAWPRLTEKVRATILTLIQT